MRLIVAGSRGFQSYPVICLAFVELGLRPSVILSGTARGADRLGEKYAELHGIPIERHPAPWKEHPRRAGRIRNEEMAARADALLAFWDGRSPGTRHMIETARALGLAVYVRSV